MVLEGQVTALSFINSLLYNFFLIFNYFFKDVSEFFLDFFFTGSLDYYVQFFFYFFEVFLNFF